MKKTLFIVFSHNRTANSESSLNNGYEQLGVVLACSLVLNPFYLALDFVDKSGLKYFLPRFELWTSRTTNCFHNSSEQLVLILF